MDKRLSGRLYIISTPIGNLGDLSSRAQDALARADLVLAEDTRVTLKLLNYLGLSRKLLSCHQHNERKRLPVLGRASLAGKTVCLVCDAGTPAICDPGRFIVQAAVELGMEVVPVPGPAAFLAALMSSGLDCDRFVFEGFLPAKSRERRKRLDELVGERRALVFYISPHDLIKTFADITACLGERKACLARELTKLHEEFYRGSLGQICARLASCKPKGEYVLVVAGAGAAEKPAADLKAIETQLAQALAAGQPLRQAAKEIARVSQLPASQIYALGVRLKGKVPVIWRPGSEA